MVSCSTWMTTKIKWSRHRFFLYGCDGSLGVHVLKLGIKIPNFKTTRLAYERFENSCSGSTITREEGLAPSRRPFENGTN